ncbi:MAG: thiolase domain-containing protein [Methanobacteriota archaeon]|nr:MAG: thiolase domain-containing protein [Euryarchaeota archaeon]
MSRKVAIIGVGFAKFGERWDKGLRDLALEAGTAAIADAKIGGEDVDAGYVGNMAGGSLVGQEHLGSLLADQLGLLPKPITRVEAACASGGLALRQGYMAVASGIHDIVVVGGVEKMTDLSTAQVAEILGGAGDQEWELFMGATFPALYAMLARAYMEKFGATEESLAHVAVKNHKHAVNVPYAQYRKEISVEQVLNSKEVASPLKILDCSPITDGAAAVVLAPLDVASSYTDKPVEIIASAQATDTISLHDRESLVELKAAKVASQNAYKQADITPKDVDVAEVHDCFTIAEILAIEDLGFFKKGEGYKAAQEGLTAIGGEIPINTSGGLKAAGHPVGATGVKQAAEITLQLRGEATGRQVKDAEIGLTHNIGGSGGTAAIHIMKRV